MMRFQYEIYCVHTSIWFLRLNPWFISINNLTKFEKFWFGVFGWPVSKKLFDFSTGTGSQFKTHLKMQFSMNNSFITNWNYVYIVYGWPLYIAAPQPITLRWIWSCDLFNLRACVSPVIFTQTYTEIKLTKNSTNQKATNNQTKKYQ